MSNTLILPCDAGNVSDGYHTFSDLYEHRCLLWINILLTYKKHAFKTWRNQKGEKIEGWFIAGLNTNFGQATYHLPEEHWNLLPSIKEFEKNFDYDDHKSSDVLQILEKLAITNRSEATAIHNHMKVNMDALRKNMTIDANQLGDSLQTLLSEGRSFDKKKAAASFNILAQNINNLNTISDDKDESFNDLTETVKVCPLPDEE